MSQQPGEAVVPFAAFLEARERRRSRLFAASQPPALDQFPDDSPPAAAVAVALAREAGSATSRSGFQDETRPSGWTPPDSPNRGSF
jgi:hypothetical protein